MFYKGKRKIGPIKRINSLNISSLSYIKMLPQLFGYRVPKFVIRKKFFMKLN